MSHSRGFLRSRCPGNWAKSGKPSDGFQKWKCPKCKTMKTTKVRPCFLGFHNMGRTRKDPTIKCRRCATPKRTL